MEEKAFHSIVCPNCGANTTNTKNCEYCGSLLVRLVDSNISISNYKEEYIFPEIVSALKHSLELQKKTSEPIRTTVSLPDNRKPDVQFIINPVTVIRAKRSEWSDHSLAHLSTSDYGLEMIAGFPQCLDDSIDGDKEIVKRFNEYFERRHAAFKSIPSFGLFTPHFTPQNTIDGVRYSDYEYGISFGADPEGTARIVSEILMNVYGVKEGDFLPIKTEICNTGTGKNSFLNSIPKKWIIIGVVLLIIASLLL